MLDELVPRARRDAPGLVGGRRATVLSSKNCWRFSRPAPSWRSCGLGSGDPLGPRRQTRVETGALQAASVIEPCLLERADTGARRRRAVAWPLLEDVPSAASRPLVGGETEYTFKHALTREVVYGGVPKAARELHAVAAFPARACRGATRSTLSPTTRAGRQSRDSDLAWADEPEELRRLRVRAQQLGEAPYRDRITTTSAGVAALQRAEQAARRSNLAPIGRARSSSTASASEGDEANAKLTDDPEMQPGHPGRPRATRSAPVCGRCIRHRRGRRLVGEHFELAAGQPGVRARLDRPRLLESVGGACCGTRGARRQHDLALRSFAWGARASSAFAERDYDQAFDWASTGRRCPDRRSRPQTEIYEGDPPCR
jgi:hypothetical protein